MSDNLSGTGTPSSQMELQANPITPVEVTLLIEKAEHNFKRKTEINLNKFVGILKEDFYHDKVIDIPPEKQRWTCNEAHMVDTAQLKDFLKGADRTIKITSMPAQAQ